MENSKEVLGFNDLLKALDSKVNTNVIKVYINSLDCHVTLKEIGVKESKTLSKIGIENSENQAVLYEASLAMIQSLIIDAPDDFNIMNISEFDKNKLMIAVYRQNILNEKLPVKCSNCEGDFEYVVNFDEILSAMDEMDISEQKLDIETDKLKFEIFYGFPKVSRMIEYFRILYSKKNKKLKEDSESNSVSQIDYIDLFIKRVNIIDKENSTEANPNIELDLVNCTINEALTFINHLPSVILYNSKHGAMVKINENCLQRLSSLEKKVLCPHCGEETVASIGINDFFG